MKEETKSVSSFIILCIFVINHNCILYFLGVKVVFWCTYKDLKHLSENKNIIENENLMLYDFLDTFRF